MKNIIIIGLVFLSTAVALQTKAQVKPYMSSFESALLKLSPYIINEEAYKQTENKKSISSALKDLNVSIQAVKHDKSIEQTSLKFRFEVLADGIKDVESSFNKGAVDYSYWNLKSQLHQCSSCHTERQLVSRLQDYDFYKNSNLFTQAEFQFMLRNYDSAFNKYVDLIEKYDGKNMTHEELNRSVKKIGYYLVRVKKEDALSLKTFKSLKKNKNLPQYMKKNLDKWVDYLEVKKYRIFPSEAENQNLEALKQFVADREKIADHFGVGSDRFLIDQETLIYLHNVLNTETNQKNIPWFYYWIGYMSADYKESLFDQTGQLYLQECVKKYPKSDVVEQCKKELKSIEEQ
ncbi:MAG: hypothetical protein ACK41T_10390 [Pseudobdellovibrio sp.]